MQRSTGAVAFAIVTTLVAAPPLLDWFSEPGRSCDYRASPARFERAELIRSPQPGSTRFGLSVKYRYRADGREYISDRVFCTEQAGLQSQNRIRAFSEAVREGELIVARWKPEKPAEGCISINSEFGFNTMHNVARQCLQ